MVVSYEGKTIPNNAKWLIPVNASTECSSTQKEDRKCPTEEYQPFPSRFFRFEVYIVQFCHFFQFLFDTVRVLDVDQMSDAFWFGLEWKRDK